MFKVYFKPSFIKIFTKLEKDLQEEVLEKIELFKDSKNHKTLKVHKLHGKFSDCFSFSVDYKTRIVFQYESRNEVVLLIMGDHDIYR